MHRCVRAFPPSSAWGSSRIENRGTGPPSRPRGQPKELIVLASHRIKYLLVNDLLSFLLSVQILPICFVCQCVSIYFFSFRCCVINTVQLPCVHRLHSRSHYTEGITMKNLVNQYLPFVIISALMLSALTFLGGLLGFLLTEDALYIGVGITGMNAMFFSVVFGMASLFLLD